MQSSVDLRHGHPTGDPTLRAVLARRLQSDLGITTNADAIVTTIGATPACESMTKARCPTLSPALC